MISYNFPILYTKDSKNNLRSWNISVKNNNDYSSIFCEHGLIDGKKTQTERKITKGKNYGKKNATNHYQQAIKEAETKWKDKLKGNDYWQENQNDNINQTTYLPMLAQDYKKHKSKIEFPCYIQPKLDGYRGIYTRNKIFSRTAMEFLHLDHIINSIKNMNMILDGELYNHGELSFQELGVLKKKKIDDKDLEILSKIKYYVYDIIDENLSFDNRLHILKQLDKYNNIVIVPTFLCNNQDDIEKLHLQFIKDGYEGTILRNKNSKYEINKRSYNLQKYKNFDDSEFEIINFTSENEGMIIWICKTQNGKEFKVVSKGTKDERKNLFKEGNKYIGQNLCVQYFGLTDDGIPRFPKTLRNGIESIRNFQI